MMLSQLGVRSKHWLRSVQVRRATPCSLRLAVAASAAPTPPPASHEDWRPLVLWLQDVGGFVHGGVQLCVLTDEAGSSSRELRACEVRERLESPR